LGWTGWIHPRLSAHPDQGLPRVKMYWISLSKPHLTFGGEEWVNVRAWRSSF
jgi:hypothetical protein